MNLILAIDLMNGKVVKAFAGLRFNYKPLVSIEVGITKFVKWYKHYYQI